jgi:hypothetical protein
MEQNYLLELEGKSAGRFFAFTGGTIQADVVTLGAFQGSIRPKQIGSVKYQDMVLTCGTGMSRGFYEWVGTSFGGAATRRNGAVVALDRKQKPIARLEFKEALVTSLVLPGLDRSANKEAFLTVSISPEMTTPTKAEASAKLGVYVSTLQKAWNVGSFRLRIDGLETDCARVTHVGSLKLGQKITTFDVGDSRNPTKEPTTTEYPNLFVRLPEMSADGFYKWHDDFVVNGNNSSAFEKKGTLEFFAPNSTKAYFGLKFAGLGIFQIESASGLRTKSGLPLTVGMYCESMRFYAGASAIM